MVVFHGLEDEFGLRGDAGVATTASVTQDGAGHVGAVARMRVGGGPVADDVRAGQDAATEVTVVRVQAGIGDGDDDAGPVQGGCEAVGDGSDLHVGSGHVVEHGVHRFGTDPHQGGLHGHSEQVRGTKQSTPSPRVEFGRPFEHLEGDLRHLLQHVKRGSGQGHARQRTCITTPPFQAHLFALQGLRTTFQQEHVEVGVVEQHGDGDLMHCEEVRATVQHVEGIR